MSGNEKFLMGGLHHEVQNDKIVEKLKKMGLNGDKFTVKLIPLNRTNNSESNELKTYANYSNYDKLVDLTRSFEQEGISSANV